MRKLLSMALIATLGLSTTSVYAQENETPTLQINDENTVQYQDENGNWVDLGSVQQLRELLFPEETSAIEISEDGELILYGQETGYYLIKIDSEKEEAEDTYTVSITYMTDDGNVVEEKDFEFPNGTYEEIELPEGYEAISDMTFTVEDAEVSKIILVKEVEVTEETPEPTEEPEETAEPTAAAEETEEPEADPTAEPQDEEDVEPTDAPSEETVDEADTSLSSVHITYINYADGATVDTETLELEAGTYEDYLTAPKGYELVSDNAFEVTDNQTLFKLVIVQEVEETEEVDEEDVEPNVSFRYIDSQGKVMETVEVYLEAGKYDTMPGDGEIAVPLLDGYNNAYPVTIEVPEGNSVFDILVIQQ